MDREKLQMKQALTCPRDRPPAPPKKLSRAFQGLNLYGPVSGLEPYNSAITKDVSESVCSLSIVLSHNNFLLHAHAISFQIHIKVKPSMHLKVVLK